MLRLWLAVGLCWIFGAALADEIELNPSHPERYTVVRGDTLWDIAGRFLNRPWQWPEIWQENRQIANPHLIYPGDVLVLTWAGGRPQLQVEAPSELRLSPKVRSTPLETAIPAIPMNAIRQFLTKPQVLTADQSARAPYVLSVAEEHVVGGAGNRIFVRSIPTATGDTYSLLRPGKPYQDAETGELLGYEGIFVGDAELEQAGDPATLLITNSQLEAVIGDRLLPTEPETIRIAFQPHPPAGRIRGHIISVVGAVTQVGQYSVVAIDRGTADGVDVGTVLAIWQQGKLVRDIVGSSYGESIATPDQETGLLMVFRSFDRVSYALVMKATRFLHLFDIVTTP